MSQEAQLSGTFIRRNVVGISVSRGIIHMMSKSCFPPAAPYRSHSAATDRLISNPSLIDRARWLISRLLSNPRAGFLDHRVAKYCRKLEAVAVARLEAR